jgi:hypothetical protein
MKGVGIAETAGRHGLIAGRELSGLQGILSA